MLSKGGSKEWKAEIRLQINGCFLIPSHKGCTGAPQLCEGFSVTPSTHTSDDPSEPVLIISRVLRESSRSRNNCVEFQFHFDSPVTANTGPSHQGKFSICHERLRGAGKTSIYSKCFNKTTRFWHSLKTNWVTFASGMWCVFVAVVCCMRVKTRGNPLKQNFPKGTITSNTTNDIFMKCSYVYEIERVTQYCWSTKQTQSFLTYLKTPRKHQDMKLKLIRAKHHIIRHVYSMWSSDSADINFNHTSPIKTRNE